MSPEPPLTGETALFRSLFDQLKTGDLVLADRYYGGWFMLALLQELGVQFVTRLHQFRTADFSRGKSLGKDDHVVTWPKPQRPKWLDQEAYRYNPPACAGALCPLDWFLVQVDESRKVFIFIYNIRGRFKAFPLKVTEDSLALPL